MIDTLESALGKKAKRVFLPVPAGDMPVTFASLDKSRRLLGYSPKVSFEEGIRLFAEWLRG
jgi:UDP-glucuronate 4-epimerase